MSINDNLQLCKGENYAEIQQKSVGESIAGSCCIVTVRESVRNGTCNVILGVRVGVLATAAIVLSGFSGAFLCGKYRRKHGIAEGTLCGIIIFALITVISVVITDNIPDLKKLVLLALSGAVGGVCGVNSKRPDKLMN